MELSIKGRLKSMVEGTNLGYSLLLAKQCGIIHPSRRPQAPWINSVLGTKEDLERAVDEVKMLGLPLMDDRAKNWDSLAALNCILTHTTPSARILDAGAELYSMILPWLFLYGYRKLEGINLVFKQSLKRGSIIYDYGDITHTKYPSGTFDAVTCLSVIEHGVNLDMWFAEMSRILKPGGLLITSTDYWETLVETQGKSAYGVPVHIFCRDEILQALDIARREDLFLTGPISLTSQEKVVHWKTVGLDYTFIVFALRKMAGCP